ncbi:MAG: alpha-amylase family glycosyl hydrolase [Flavobacteriales bacterium]
MRYKILVSILAFAISFGMQAQILWSDPAFPTQDDQVTLYYNAALGNAGVMGVIPLYIHTGVITTVSNGPSDWQHVVGNWGTADSQVLMQYTSNNIYTFNFGGLTLADFYNLNNGEDILQLSMVFRNTNGTLVGREEDGSDIYYDISDGGFQGVFINPAQNTAIQVGDSQEIEIITSLDADISLLINGIEVTSDADTNALSYVFEGVEASENEIIFNAVSGLESSTDTIYITVIGENVIADSPTGILDGINYTSSTTATLQIYAPGKEQIFVVGDFNNWNIDLDYQMNQTADGNTFWIELNNLVPQQEYRFHYHIFPDNIRVGDAYSEKFLDKWNDGWIPETTYPDLLPFPEDVTSSEPVSILQTDQTEFIWTDNNYTRPAKESLIIYEMLVRDFSEERTFEFIKDTLDYLQNLGITAIEIMPFVEFNGNDSWGYNNAMYFAPDKAYGTKEKLQEFINEAHNRGIAVIMDVAFNHADLPNPFLRMYWDENFGEWGAPAIDNPWFNQTAPHNLNWFFDWNHDSPKTKEYVKRFMEHWVNEYHLDGWRWDYSQGMTQTNTIGGNSGTYDQSRINTIMDYGNHIWAVDPNIYMILEHWTDNNEETILANAGYMLWGNLGHEYQEASMGYASNFAWGSYQNRGWNLPGLITYMESHDEERLMYKNLMYGNSSTGYDINDLETALSRIELTACFHIPIPGPKMIWQFGELGYDYSINHCQDGTVNDACRIVAKPVRWDYRANPNRYRVYQVMASLNKLKTTYPVFSTTDFSMDTDGVGKTIHLNDDEMNVVVVGNFGVTALNITPVFQHTGMWFDYFSGDTIVVSDINVVINHQPGEYHLYTDMYLETPELNTSVNELSMSQMPAVWPNPASENVHIDLREFAGERVTIQLVDARGQVVRTIADGRTFGDQVIEVSVKDVSAGFYLMTFRTADGVSTVRLVVE